MRDRLRRMFRTSSRPPARDARDAEQMPSQGTIAVRNNSDGKGHWEIALEKLPEADKEIVLKYSLSDSDVGETPDVLLQAAQRKRALCEAKKWRFIVNGRTLILKDAADKIIQWLDKMKSVGDIATTADPVHAALPWAGVRVLLVAATSESQLMGSLLVGIDRVLYLLNRCKVYELLYPYDIAIDAAYQNFSAGLTDLYVLILQFLATAIRVYEKNTARRTWESFWSPDCIGDFDARFQAETTRVDIEAQNCERLYSQKGRQISSRQEQDLRRLLESIENIKNLHGHVQRIDFKVQDIWQSLDDEKRSNALLWISNIPFEDHHRFARERRTPDTGGWLLEHETYMEWQSSKSTILWLHGIPGAGKTKLVSRVVDHLSNSDQTLLYFYCNRNEESRRKPGNILRSFVKQLSFSRDETSIHRTLLKVYEARLRNGFSSFELSLDETRNILDELVSSYPRVTFVLDALDEVDEVSRKHLLKWLNALVENSPNAKIFVSSRRDDDIKRQLEKKANVGIEATDNADDIAKFVAERIREDEEERAYPITDTLRTEIVQVLLQKSGGMFQWAALQITEVLSLKLECEIRDRLGRLPEGLKEAYDEISDKIQRKKGIESTIANRAFQWVMCAQEPLSSRRLVAAVSQDSEDNITRDPYVDISFILGACCNLLVVDEQGACRFSHLSVREYLEDYRWTMDQCLATVAKVCLTLLLDQNNLKAVEGRIDFPRELNECLGYILATGLDSSDEDPSFTPLQALTIYAARFWPAHIRSLSVIDDRLFGLAERFIGSPSNLSDIFLAWTKSNRFATGGTPISYTEGSAGPLRFICRVGLSQIFLRWIQMGKLDFGQLKDEVGSLLKVSVMGSSTQIVQSLVANGANVNQIISDGAFATVLEAGAGCPEIVKILLDAGADAKAQSSCGYYGSALAAAATKPHNTKSIGLLLDAGADPNALLSVGYYGSALAAGASSPNNADVVRLLLDSGADANAMLKCGRFGSALAAAASALNNAESIRSLLDSGADANAVLVCGAYGSALAAAASGGMDSTVEIRQLIDAGADPNAPLTRTSDGSPLTVAARWGSGKNMKLLLENGADVNTMSDHGHSGSALIAATKFGSMENIQLLLDAGADVNAISSCGDVRTPLIAAALYGTKDTIQLLLNAGADPNAQSLQGKWTSPLATALKVYCKASSQNPARMENIRMLLDAGADVDLALLTGEHETVLGMAEAYGLEEVLEIFLPHRNRSRETGVSADYNDQRSIALQSIEGKCTSGASSGHI